MTWKVEQGDCIDAMRDMDEASVDAIVTDPPYGLHFMGKSWDQFGGALGRDHREGRERSGSMHAGEYDLSRNAEFQREMTTWATEALRVLKPGGHLLAFGGTRTSHRLACAIEDAGFEIRDSLLWLYGSGFPKSHDVSKAIDKAAGAEREVVGRTSRCVGPSQDEGYLGTGTFRGGTNDLTAPATPEAEKWQGWGTALKPAHEPIVVGRKPLVGTVARNVVEHGAGALNIDGCRVGHADAADLAASQAKNPGREDVVTSDVYGAGRPQQRVNADGRWPANVVLSHTENCRAVGMRRVRTGDPTSADGQIKHKANAIYGARGEAASQDTNYADSDGLETVERWECAEGCPVAELDRQSGERASSGGRVSDSGMFAMRAQPAVDTGYGDTGGASRFYYTAKASRAERNAGLEGMPAVPTRGNYGDGIQDSRPHTREGYEYRARTQNVHPTVKPLALMRWLCRLVTPPDGLILDPFAGSGTTGCAAVLEGFNFVGIEREPEYVEIARARIAYWANPKTHEARLAEAERDRAEAQAEETGQPVQLGLLG